jgi:hypothetical protein
MTAEEFKAYRKKQEKKIADLLHSIASEQSLIKSYLFDLCVRSSRQESKKWVKFYGELDWLMYHQGEGLERISDKVNGRSR